MWRAGARSQQLIYGSATAVISRSLSTMEINYKNTCENTWIDSDHRGRGCDGCGFSHAWVYSTVGTPA